MKQSLRELSCINARVIYREFGSFQKTVRFSLRYDPAAPFIPAHPLREFSKILKRRSFKRRARSNSGIHERVAYSRDVSNVSHNGTSLCVRDIYRDKNCHHFKTDVDNFIIYDHDRNRSGQIFSSSVRLLTRPTGLLSGKRFEKVGNFRTSRHTQTRPPTCRTYVGRSANNY